MKTPKELGYFFPAEWEKHHATWLSWPHKEASWPGKLEKIFPVYAHFVSILTHGENVCINVNDEIMQRKAEAFLVQANARMEKVRFFHHPTNDAWCRDHGPAFLIHHTDRSKKAIVDWGYNAWGNKYPPYDLDDNIPTLISQYYDIPCFYPGIIMEGGSVDFNGQGAVLTTKSCLLNKNRNPDLSQKEIENYLEQYYGADQVLWLESGIEGDDTDGHIDDITRFVSAEKVLTILPDNLGHPDYKVLRENLKLLESMKLLNGKSLEVMTLPVPAIYEEEGQILPCSYANFYISNAAVIVPTFQDPNDEKALEIISSCFKDRKVIGLNSKDIIWGLGSFHCLSQQEPF
ncbi:MAG: agmatine deiminase family protein [Parachlamydiaceae bacterium]|nr:agmatine deiminase family protein [Parachlamydiaceae bacterium]